MGPKTRTPQGSKMKGRKETWITCSVSGIIHNINDASHHQTFLENGDSEYYAKITPERILCAKLESKIEKLVWNRLPLCTLMRSLFVSPSLMSKISWSFGSRVLIDGKYVFFVWPDPSVEIVSVWNVTPFPIPDTNVLLIESFDQCVFMADKVIVEPLGDEEQRLQDQTSFRSALKSSLMDTVITEGNVALVCYYGKFLRFKVFKIDNNNEEPAASSTPSKASTAKTFYKIVSETQIVLKKDVILPMTVSQTFKIRDLIAGLNDELSILERALKSLAEFSKPEGVIRPYNGFLLYGPSGTGKSVIGRNIGAELGYRTISISSPDVYSKFYGETESKLKSVFEKAAGNGEGRPCILFIDDIDSLCPKREVAKSDQEKRVTSTFIHMLDKYKSSTLVVIAASNRPENIDSVLRRPGRLDYEIEIGVPNPSARLEILTLLLTDVKHELIPEELSKIANSTHGYVGADLEALVTESRNRSEIIRASDFEAAAKTIKPSAMREVMIEIPNVTWDDIGGLDELKLKLRQAVEWPLKKPEVFEKMGITPPKGILMYGPPGCSKTMIAKALANESGLNFIAIKGPELFSKWVGESERAVRELFRKARRVSPCIVFFDEIDALGSERSGESKVGDRILAQLLIEMDGIEVLKSVTIVAATNRPDMIDSALMRPGRLDRIVYVPLPDAATRKKVFLIHTKRTPIDDDVDIEELVEKTDGYSGAEIVAVCNEAALKAIEENVNSERVSRRHFLIALSIITPRINDELLRIYKKFSDSRKNI